MEGKRKLSEQAEDCPVIIVVRRGQFGDKRGKNLLHDGKTILH